MSDSYSVESSPASLPSAALGEGGARALPRRAFLGLLGAAGLGVLSACGAATSAPAPSPAAASSAAPAASAKPVAPTSASAAAKPAASAAAKPAASGPKPKIQAGWVSPSAAYSPLLIATDAGYFSNHGVDVEPVYIEGSSKLVAATIAGDVQVMLISGETAVDGNVNAGQDFAIIAATGDHSFQQVISGPKLSQASDLKGKTIAVVTGGTVPLYQLTRAMEIQGLNVKDSNITYLGGYPAIISAISAGQVDAGVMTTDFARLGVKQGLKVILDIEAMHILTPNTPVIAKRSYIKTHHDELLNFLKGYAEGIHRLKTDKAFAIQTMSKYFKIDDQQSLEGSYTDASKVLNDLLLAPAAVQAVLDEDGIKDRKPEEFMDMSMAQELHDDGFIDALWKS